MATNNVINSPKPFPIADGGTAVSSVTTSPTATSFAGWDANRNMSADSFLSGYTTTATAAGTTTLTVNDTFQQFFTGVTTQTVVLPVTSTLVLGQAFFIVNNSSGVVTVQSSGANTIQAMAANTTLMVTCILTSGTSAASWYAQYLSLSGSGIVNSGLINQLAYYAAAGSTLSGLATANNGLLTTNSSGVPSITLLSNLGINASLVKTVKTQVITTTSTYTPSTGMLYCITELCGGGGGGGGAGTVTVSNALGGGGAYAASCRKTYTAAEIGANAAVVIGAAGAAGAAASGNGGTGGTSTFTPAGAGAVLTAPGGGGGGGGVGNLSAVGVEGTPGARPSIATGGDINDAGAPGHYAFVFGLVSSTQQISGGGASGKYGTGGTELSGSTQVGQAALGFGAGGGGAISGGVNSAGGAGTAGVCIVTEFCNQ